MERRQAIALKQWDGKKLLVDKEWLVQLYPDIYTGKQVQLPCGGSSRVAGPVTYYNYQSSSDNDALSTTPAVDSL